MILYLSAALQQCPLKINGAYCSSRKVTADSILLTVCLQVNSDL